MIISIFLLLNFCIFLTADEAKDKAIIQDIVHDQILESSKEQSMYLTPEWKSKNNWITLADECNTDKLVHEKQLIAKKAYIKKHKIAARNGLTEEQKSKRIKKDRKQKKLQEDKIKSRCDEYQSNVDQVFDTFIHQFDNFDWHNGLNKRIQLSHNVPKYTLDTYNPTNQDIKDDVEKRSTQIDPKDYISPSLKNEVDTSKNINNKHETLTDTEERDQSRINQKYHEMDESQKFHTNRVNTKLSNMEKQFEDEINKKKYQNAMKDLKNQESGKINTIYD